MEYRILGPLEVVREGVSLDLGPKKQRSVLALLLLHANRVVSTDRLLDEVWGDEASGKENVLWVYISRLRSILEPNRDDSGHRVLLTRDHGYTLVAEPDSIDANRFEQAVSAASALVVDDPETASEMVTSALDLWRGDALQDFTYEDFAQPEITRLHEMRRRALEDRFDADLRRGLAGELIGELERHQEENPLRERPVGQLMLALYRAGRAADALRAFGSFRDRIGEELGIEPSPELARLEEQILLHDERIQRRGATAEPRRETPNPYKGLRAFAEDDAADFFGRDRLIAELVRRLAAGSTLTALVGASGSGKSSVLRAGLVPVLRKAAIDGSDRWLIAQMMPGSHPFAELEAALLRTTIDAPGSLDQLRGGDSDGLLRAILRISPTDSTKVLLIIDQFEELFTLVADESVREGFLDNLLVALDDPHHRLMVVVALRADYYDRPLSHPEFGVKLGAGVVNVVPLTPDELEAAIEEPSRGAGVAVESVLLAEMIGDVIGQPGILPMLQYTLSELFDRRSGDVLDAETYREMGGVSGAITQRAEELFAQLSEGEQAAARQLFLRLVSIGGHGESTRRRVLASEILSLDVEVAHTQAAIDLFGSHRLLTFDRDAVSGSPTVEVAHESLLQEWTRLRRWIAEAQDDLRRHSILAAAAREWRHAGRHDDYVYTGSRLADFAEWAETTSMRLTVGEREFLDASGRREEAEQAAEAVRTAEAARLRRSAVVRPLLVALAVAAAVAVVSVVLALQPGKPTVAIVTQSSGSAAEVLQRGLDRAATELEVDIRLIGGGTSDLERDVRDLADGGADLVVLDLVAADWIEGVVADYPETAFATIGRQDPPPGSRSVVFIDQEGAYLAGAAAALATKSGNIGFLAPIQTETNELMRGGFEAGAKAVDPETRVLGGYVGSDLSALSDDNGAQLMAERIFEARADVLFSIGNIEGAALAAWEASRTTPIHRWVIAGDGVDAWIGIPDHLKPHILTSLLRRTDEIVFELVERLTDDTLAPGFEFVGIADDAFDLARSGNFMSATDLGVIEALERGVTDGRQEPIQYPGSVVLSPGFQRPEVSVFVTWWGDGSCSYAASTPPLGAARFDSGDLIGINFLNRSPTGAAMRLTSGGRYPGLTALAAPGSDTKLFTTVGPGNYEIACVAEKDAENAVSAAAIKVEDPQSCPAGSGVATTGVDTPVERYYRAVEDRDLNAALDVFHDDATLGPSPDGVTHAVTDFVHWNVIAAPPQTVEIYNIAVGADTITWDEDWYDDQGRLRRSCGLRAEVVADKIVRWEFGSQPPGP